MMSDPEPKATARARIVSDEVPQVLAALKELLSTEVLVGIPEGTANRTATGGPITNAALGYIHEFGAPEANIPARPFLIPGVQAALPAVLPHLVAAAKAGLNGEVSDAEAHLQGAGMIAASRVKTELRNNGPPLNSSTVRNRRYGRQSESRRDSELRYLKLVKGGMSPAEAQSAAGVRPLVDTGQFRNAITSVVRKDGNASASSSSSEAGAESSYEQAMEEIPVAGCEWRGGVRGAQR